MTEGHSVGEAGVSAMLGSILVLGPVLERPKTNKTNRVAEIRANITYNSNNTARILSSFYEHLGSHARGFGRDFKGKIFAKLHLKGRVCPSVRHV